jgi:acetyl esterase
VKGVCTSEHRYPSEIDGYENAAILYSPDTGNVKRPLIIFIHGGGWALGSCFSKGHSDLCTKFCRELQYYVLSIDHRMAPEHPYPVPPQDCYSALLWLANTITVPEAADRQNVIMMGDSAGGNLAAVTALKWRDEQPAGITVVHQALLYPCFFKRPLTKRSIYASI